MFDFITLPRIIPAISLLGVWNIWMKNKRGFVYHAIAAILWCGYDMSIGAIEQGLYVLTSVVFSAIGYWKWNKDERKS